MQSDNTDEIVDVISRQLQSAFKLNKLFLEMDREEKALFLSTDYSDFLKRSPLIQYKVRAIDERIRELRTSAISDLGPDVDKIASDFAIYVSIQNQIIHLMELDFILAGVGRSSEFRNASLGDLRATTTRILANCRQSLRKQPGIKLGACSAIASDILGLLKKLEGKRDNIVFTYLRSGDPARADTSFAENLHTLYLRTQELSNVISPDQKSLLKTHLLLMYTWLTRHAGSDKPQMPGSDSEGLEVSSFKAWEIRANIESLVERVIQHTEKSLAARKDFSSRIYQRSQTVFIIVSIVCMILATIFGLYILNSVRRPIRALTRMAERVSQGELDVSVTHKDPDELGAMARAFNNMTESLRSSTKELERAKSSAEKANKAKSDFLAQMSHEIRTPLNAIVGLSDILCETKASVEVRGYVRKINSAAGALLQIINDILDISKIEAGKLQIENTAFDLQDLVKSTTNLFFDRARQKGISLVIDIRKDQHRFFVGDPLRIQQILINLINNAIKFTQFGSVAVALDCKVPAGDGSGIAITVKDTGIGIGKVEVKRLFEPYDQAEISTAREFGGTGLGLNITKSLVDMMDGTIEVKSVIGQGSTFRVILPLNEAKSTDVTSPLDFDEFDLLEDHDLAPLLIVDDNDLNREVLSLILSKFGLQSRAVDSGGAALAAIAEEDFSLVFLDCIMDGIDGFETARRIRSMTNGKEKIPIVALTAGLMEDFQSKCLEAGMDDFLTKPIDKSKVIAAIRKWCLQKKPVSTSVKDQQNPPAEESSEINMEILGPLLTLDQERSINLIHMISKSLEKNLRGLEAAASEENFESLGRIAHTIKGSSASVGSITIPQLCSSIESTLKAKDTERLQELIAAIKDEMRKFQLSIKTMHSGGAYHS